MNAKVFERTLPDDPREEDYIYWKRMLHIYIAKANVPGGSKLKVLLVLCRARTYPIVEESETFEVAIEHLESKFIKKGSNIMMRHKLRTRKQKENESIREFMSSLQVQAKKCEIQTLTADRYQEILIEDAFVAGLQSPSIKQRLLKSSDNSLETLYKLAQTMEVAIEDTCNLSQGSAGIDQPPHLAAAKSACFWCGGDIH
ncbi:uncharacterized protein LOC115225568 [Octopus sinensis]|uniref:Uncharacterized protein LOC115225568 n=1 Tax=Octopus sinensis TaxID=2607531 RepID=A0A6P7TKE9_9MOLL|nr:uncharacterized protein LOC115225568 [Octopus sinensis]